MDDGPNYEIMLRNAARRTDELEKENEQLKKEIESWEAFEVKLQDRIDGLEQIITILTKIYL